MTTENSFSKLTHPANIEVKLKNVHGKADILKELFKCVSETNLPELALILDSNEMADKSMNITLSRAFTVYSPSNKDTKDIIKVLLDHKANPNVNLDTYVKHAIKDKRGSNSFISGLMLAALENDIYLANILISHNCNVNLTDHLNRSALFHAINSGGDSSEMVQVLIGGGVNVNAVDIDGLSPLTLAVQKGDKEITRILLNYNADVDHQSGKDCNTAMHYAVTNNKPELIYLLLLRKPDLNIRNKNYQTPMEIATSLSRTEVYQILAEEYNQREAEMKRDAATKRDETNIMNNLANVMSMKLSLANVNTNTKESNYSNDSQGSNNELIIDDQNCLVEEENILRNNLHNVHNVIHNVHNLNNMSVNNKFFPGSQNIQGHTGSVSSNLSQKNNQMSNTLNPNQYNTIPGMNMPNINININNLTSNNNNNNNNTRTGIPFNHKYTKNAKLQKLRYLQENRQYSEQNGRSIKDKMFRFPSGLNNNITNIEIPFSFQSEKVQINPGNNTIYTGTNMYNKGNQLHTFIKIQSTPVLHIDISDNSKQDQFVLSSQIEELKLSGNTQIKRINQLEVELTNTLDENVSMKNEVNRLKEELNNKDKFTNKLSIEFSTKETEYTHKIEDLHTKIKDETTSYLNLLNKFEILEKEFSELNKECYSKFLSEGKGNKSDKDTCKKEFLEKKFSCLKYDEKYIIKCLQRDILDFQEYTKEQIKKVKSSQEELIKLIQETVSDCMPDYEVRLYGSHATNLCLHWSDLDVVLTHKKNFNATNYNALQSLYISILEKTWKKSIKLIDSAVVPLIKIISSDLYNNMHIDITLQDNRHYGLKCVDLVKSFLKEYEALEPLIFALKNILKNANLNDPYLGGLSSYGLILMVVSFLQSQQENNKSIKISEGNLGRMFLEFLWYYGLMFDHTKYVIYAFPTNEAVTDKDSSNFLFNIQPTHELIIVDPLNKNNNVARSTFQFVNIKMAFMIGFVVSHEECECGCHYNKIGEESHVYNTDHCILKRIFNSVKRFNANNPSPST